MKRKFKNIFKGTGKVHFLLIQFFSIDIIRNEFKYFGSFLYLIYLGNMRAASLSSVKFIRFNRFRIEFCVWKNPGIVKTRIQQCCHLLWNCSPVNMTELRFEGWNDKSLCISVQENSKMIWSYKAQSYQLFWNLNLKK